MLWGFTHTPFPPLPSSRANRLQGHFHMTCSISGEGMWSPVTEYPTDSGLSNKAIYHVHTAGSLGGEGSRFGERITSTMLSKLRPFLSFCSAMLRTLTFCLQAPCLLLSDSCYGDSDNFIQGIREKGQGALYLSGQKNVARKSLGKLPLPSHWPELRKCSRDAGKMEVLQVGSGCS